MRRIVLIGGALLALPGVVAPSVAAAQGMPPGGVPPGVLPQGPITEQGARDAIRRSGLSDDEVRARLRAAGYDAALVERYLGPESPESAQRPVPAPSLRALRAVGVSLAATYSDVTTRAADSPTDLAVEGDSVEVDDDADGSAVLVGPRPQVFGKTVFSRRSTLFTPVSSGAVDPSYRIGSGDTLQVVLTGQVEAAYQVAVRRDGSIVLPRVGTVQLAGLTQDAARGVLRQRAAALWSGVSAGRTSVDLSVSRTRTALVYVMGEVEHPGAYSVSALSTVFYALARAGGPAPSGSFRQVELRRAGQVVRRLDLYDYLARGDASGDVRLEQGDIVYVPLAGRTVHVVGAVRRQGIFELTENEGFRDLLVFTGGPLATASSERVQVDRVLPPERRAPGRERVLVDLRVGSDFRRLDAEPLFDGDVVRFPAIGPLRRNVATIHGAVVDSGVFALTPTMTVRDLIAAAQGPLPWALTDRVMLRRRRPSTGTSEFLTIDLADSAAAATRVMEYDSVMVLDARRQHPVRFVTVTGAVFGGTRTMPYATRMSLRDAIDIAGGLREEAVAVEVARRRVTAEFSDTTSEMHRFEIVGDGSTEPALSQFALRPDDRVFVRAAPGYRNQRFIEVTGLFKSPGSYAVNEGVDRLSDVVAKAGGLLPGALVESFRLIREGRPVAVDLRAALQKRPSDDLFVLQGDRVSIEANPMTVLVTGEVQRSLLIVYNPKFSVGDYLDRAGGLRREADTDRILVETPSGTVYRVRRSLFGGWNSGGPITPGSTVTVPAKPQRAPIALRETMTVALQIASAVASLALAYVAVARR